ncbi:hypothetical protein AB670_02792 [Chryseobacterium sp. MOF25P]|uniref:hypothetical protein n=1 Tax=unclassified Chryseobacterium TaxID=2593645 RepID=UPI0008060518|nr:MULTISPECIES: hypothetical protein [unclassified Chryseobacterium]OBW40841.1 hypothetical protein AB670_02792 [Chryseobacterium sp. MOF25P]OBW45305.1 hypothetical protein AB671_02602 [Chryseobacterium sp. BGARF1]
MNKTTQKKTSYNTVILSVLANKYGFSIDYIRKCLRGDRTGLMPDELKKEYNSLEKIAKDAIEIQANQLK